MKCVKKDEVIKKVSDQLALELSQKGWTYCPKSEWKKIQKPAPVQVAIETPVEEAPKAKKAKKERK